MQPATPENNRSAGHAAPLSREDFAAQFASSFRAFWLIAAGILGRRTLAEDVVQESAVIALSKLDQFPADGNFAAWMSAIVRHVALNTARKEQRRRAGRLEEQAAQWAASGTAPVRPPSLAESSDGRLPDEQDVFDDGTVRALGAVSDIARACLLLRTIENMEYAEISRLLEIPENTAMSHVHRARQQLRMRLSGPPRPPRDATQDRL